MNFDEIPLRMMKLGVDRVWLAEKTGYTPDTIRQMLAPNGNPKAKTERAIKTIKDALDREEERKQSPATPAVLHQIVLKTNDEQFAAWNRLANRENLLITDWAIKSLSLIANSEISHAFLNESAKVLRPNEDERKPAAQGASLAADTRKSVIELPLLRAAAGSPILSDAEMVEVDQDYGTGRFVLELRGDSMEPDFLNRQRIIMREKSALKRPVLKYVEYYAFIVDGLITFKQWAKDKKAGDKVLRSLNPEHADIIADENTDWIGWYDTTDNL